METLKKEAIFHPKHVAPDGNCLFHAVVYLLGRENTDPTNDSDQSLNTASLRKRTIDHVLDEGDEQVTQILKTWIGLWNQAAKERDREMMQELSHVEGIHEDLTHQDRQQLAHQMADPMRWWGDELALMLMERDLDVNFIVLHGISGECIKRDYDRPRSHVAFLRLINSHYEPLYQGSSSHTLFDKDTLPIASYLLVHDAGLAKAVFEPSFWTHLDALVADTQQKLDLD